MIPELFELPFIHVTIKSYGLMMVIGFILGVSLMCHCARRIKHNPEYVTNAALYALISGVIGARIFFIMHNFDSYRNHILSIFAIWNGGLEYIGGVFLAIIVVFIYLKKKKLPVRIYMDMITIGLMIGLAFGRIGCYLNGCCFGKPTTSACSITFPYGSLAYESQAFPNYLRERTEPLINLPAEYYGYFAEDGQTWIPANESNKLRANLKPKDLLTDQQKSDVKTKYKMLRIHPSQFYSTANSLVLCLIFYLFWRKFGIKYQGCTFALMFILYGPTRFFLETLRDDNPFENAWWIIYPGGTISQNIRIYMFIIGIILMIVFPRFKSFPPEEMK